MTPPSLIGTGWDVLVATRLRLFLITLGMAAVALKAWSCICLFPIHAWNDVRLRPSFLIADGLPLYPGLNKGIITTWMYGPVHPLLFYPVTFTHDISQVFLYAALLNVSLVIAAVPVAGFLWNAYRDERPFAHTQDVMLCVVATLLVVPVIYLKFLMADTPSLVFGMLSIGLFSFGVRRSSRLILWVAAFAAVTSAFSKAHGVAVAMGEILWLVSNRRYQELGSFLGMIVTCLLAWLLIGILLASSPKAFWDHTFVLPAHLPWAPDLVGRAGALIPELVVSVLLPFAGITYLFWKKGAWRRELGIPFFIWLAALPVTLAGAFKVGGSSNSLHPVLYLVPFCLSDALKVSRERSSWSRPAVEMLVLILSIYTLVEFRENPLKPVMHRCVEAVDLSKANVNAMWLPWRPLATFLATGRHYHDEDGLHVRQLTKLYPSRPHAFEFVPASWNKTAVERPGMSWDIARQMQPGPVNYERQGHWVIYSSPGTVPKENATGP